MSKAMRFSFLLFLSTVKGLKKKKKKKKKVRSKADEFQGATRRRRRDMVRPDSKSSGIDTIPEDILMNIVARLPAKLVMSLKCVSQFWYSLISSRDFTKLFLKSPSSAKRERLLVSCVPLADHRKYEFLTSSSSRDYHSGKGKSVYVINQVLNMPGLKGYFVNALCGLICLRLGRSLRIFNLTTRQRVILPFIRSKLLTEANDNIWNAFVHNPVQDEYKVLSIVWDVNEEEEKVVSSEDQVLVLGPGASWRNSQGHIYPHRPNRERFGITINGVFYYEAWTVKNTSVIMSFDLASEDFNMIVLPIESGIFWHPLCATLMNYRDKVAVIEYSRIPSAGANLWVMEDAETGKWSKKTLVLTLSQMNLVHGDELTLVGTGRRGLVRVEKTMFIGTKPILSYIYDLEKNKILRRIKISSLSQRWNFRLYNDFRVVVWQDDVVNIMRLEI